MAPTWSYLTIHQIPFRAEEDQLKYKYLPLKRKKRNPLRTKGNRGVKEKIRTQMKKDNSQKRTEQRGTGNTSTIHETFRLPGHLRGPSSKDESTSTSGFSLISQLDVENIDGCYRYDGVNGWHLYPWNRVIKLGRSVTVVPTNKPGPMEEMTRSGKACV